MLDTDVVGRSTPGKYHRRIGRSDGTSGLTLIRRQCGLNGSDLGADAIDADRDGGRDVGRVDRPSSLPTTVNRRDDVRDRCSDPRPKSVDSVRRRVRHFPVASVYDRRRDASPPPRDTPALCSSNHNPVGSPSVPDTSCTSPFRLRGSAELRNPAREAAAAVTSLETHVPPATEGAAKTAAESQSCSEAVANCRGEAETEADHMLEEAAAADCDPPGSENRRDSMRIQIHRENSGFFRCCCRAVGWCRRCFRHAVGDDREATLLVVGVGERRDEHSSVA